METELEKYFDRLWPICRSITGNGLRESFKILKEIIPLQLSEIPTGTKVFDWEIPMEWNINDAYIITPNGNKICDFKENNLHVVNYSLPVDKIVEYGELIQHLKFLIDQPDAIPYVTSYYEEYWGFCISKSEFDQLPKEGEYRVVIESTLEKGSLTYGDLVLKGSSKKEILFSSYLCHPSMANNELSGPLCLAFLYNKIVKIPNRKYTYRFVLAPETIGTIAYLKNNNEILSKNLIGGYIITCCGDRGVFNYKMSKNENSIIDRVAKHILKYSNLNHNIIPFSVGGSDERQYCSPGFNFSVGSLMRTPYQQFKEYHNSLDNKSFISFNSLIDTIEVYFKFVELLEINDYLFNNIQFCEPQLGKRGLYPNEFEPDFNREELHRLLHLLSFSNGKNDLIYIAEKRNELALNFKNSIDKCINQNLLLIHNKIDYN
jgi:aminopeptidase-like protein